MKQITVGDSRFRILTVERADGQWVARAQRDPSGEPFGIESGGDTEGEATGRLIAWIEWQHEHAAALEALQAAERVYHRTVAGSAFANPAEGPAPFEIRKESLDEVEAARLRLDEIRARKPE